MSRYLRHDTVNADVWQDIGTAVLSEHLKTAALLFLKAVTPAYRASEIKESLVFLQGSALEVTVATFQLPYDATTLRETFFTWGQHQAARWSSATIPVGSLTAV